MLQKVCLWKWFCCICFRKFWRVSLPTFAPVAWSFLVMGDNMSACISSISYSEKRFYIVRFTPFQRRTQNPVKHLTSNFSQTFELLLSWHKTLKKIPFFSTGHKISFSSLLWAFCLLLRMGFGCELFCICGIPTFWSVFTH